jgi:hypothetical protein
VLESTALVKGLQEHMLMRDAILGGSFVAAAARATGGAAAAVTDAEL